MILAIDTTTDFAGLALYNQDTIWAEEIWNAGRNHTTQLMPRLHSMLTRAGLTVKDLSGIVVCIGPGSFTGVRIGVAAAKGLALPANIPAVGVSSLDVTAYPHQHQSMPVIAVVKAGRKRVLIARYGWEAQVWGPTDSPQITTLAELAQTITHPVLIAGEVTAAQAATLAEQTGGKATIVSPIHRVRRPGVLAELGMLKLATQKPGDLSGLKPIYLKEP